MQTSKLRLYTTTSAEDEAKGFSLNGAVIKKPDGTIAKHVKPFGNVDIVLTDDIKNLAQALYVSSDNYYCLRHIVGSVAHAMNFLQKSIDERLKQVERVVEAGLTQAQTRNLGIIKSQLGAIIDTLTMVENFPQQKAQEILLAQMSTLFMYMRSVDNHYESIRQSLPDDSTKHLDILRQVFLFSTIKAKLYFLLGNPGQAISVLKKSSENITFQATKLLQRWTVDVKLTLPDKNSADRLFQDMFEIDGVSPFDRLHQSNQTMPQIPPNLEIIALPVTEYTQGEPKNSKIPEHGLHVIRGDIIRFHNFFGSDNYFILNDSGYLLKNKNSCSYGESQSDYNLMLTGQIPPISSRVVENIHCLAEVVNDTKAAAAEAELTQHLEEVAVSIPSLIHGHQAEPDTMLLLTSPVNVLLPLPQESNESV